MFELLYSISSIGCLRRSDSAMLAIYGGPSTNTVKMLEGLDSCGAPALFFLNPQKQQFSKAAVYDVIGRGYTAGLYVDCTGVIKGGEIGDGSTDKLKERIHKLIEKSKERFVDVSGVTPYMVYFKTGGKSMLDKEELVDLAKKNQLYYKPPSFDAKFDHSLLYNTISGLNPNMGRVFIALYECEKPKAIEKIVNHIRVRGYNVIQPRAYLELECFKLNQLYLSKPGSESTSAMSKGSSQYSSSSLKLGNAINESLDLKGENSKESKNGASDILNGYSLMILLMAYLLN
ncbi:hypothetical protein PAEPH01_0339 [Pancytospora epiphaga]|nr:hypothetical protein PAEPH01_0339 [Pancytospora epiphaga]